jgi:hypothetical protein
MKASRLSLSALRHALHGAELGAFGVRASNPPVLRLIELSITVDPPHAQVFLDGRVASNPLRVAYPADDSQHELRAEAPGHQSRTKVIKFERDITVVLALAPSGTAMAR